jgi:S-DNA-T family DNA segregation ATPase FtsK/SpoIIIE
VLRGLREVGLLLCVAIAVFIFIALVTYNLEDPGWTHTGSGHTVRNAGGAVGAWLADFALAAFGVTAYLFPFMLARYSYSAFNIDRAPAGSSGLFLLGLGGLGMTAALAAGATLSELYLARLPIAVPEGSGGIIGHELADRTVAAFGPAGASLLMLVALLGGITMFSGLSWLKLIDWAGKFAMLALEHTRHALVRALCAIRKRLSRPGVAPAQVKSVREKSKAARVDPVAKHAAESPRVAITRETVRDIVRRAKPAVSYAAVGLEQLPSLSLLHESSTRVKGYSKSALEDISRQVESILRDFGIAVQVVGVEPGPVITRFEIQPAAGIKASRISALARDLARALSVTSVRIVEVIPGKSVIGLEIPNEEREIVHLRAVLSSDEYQLTPSPLTLVLGKDISGNPVAANLARMPHLLVAGTTGSGKSVAVNVMILSLLYKATPDQVRLLMIDPKMLELSVYEGIPHLLAPVVTDMKEAANALRWCVAEMERRYKLMSMLGVRNLAGYNQKVLDAAEAGEPIVDPMYSPAPFAGDEGPPALEPLPYIVIIIDELADMMMIVGKKVEELIARLAQKARAAGLHLILATQRPSVDVLTGLIKANIPTRIAFQVSSKIDSRTIIDQSGAEALLGNGDMLFLPPGSGIPARVHGAFVSDQEVHGVVEFLKRTGRTRYIEEITRFSEENGDTPGGYKADAGEELDALYDEAVRFVTESRKASISSVQRRFKVGYNRAARMIEEMENAGIVGPSETNGLREVLAPPPPPV